MGNIALIAFSLALVSCATKQRVSSKGCLAHDATAFYCVQYVSNYDGDTVKFKIPNTHPLFGENISIRVNGIDTPEMRTKDVCEKNKAKKAQRLVENILKNAKKIDLKNISRGKYFRVVADIYADGVSVSSVLIKKRLAYRYDGGRKPSSNWCAF